ncbi:MAG: hypothetical protein KUG69_03605 [Marinosulfonomonas sp.]|nr:hypothetical protein [Marinosulfonomonas sp.]
MFMAVILLGLLPLAILPDFLASDPTQGDDDENLKEGPDQSADNILDPITENDVPQPEDENVDPETILAPVIEDDLPSPDDEVVGDILLPVDEIESDADTIFINVEEFHGSGYAEVEDFDPGTDILHVLIDPDIIEDELDVAVITSENGEDADVYVEDYLIAVLKGAADATENDVFAEIGTIS